MSYSQNNDSWLPRFGNKPGDIEPGTLRKKCDALAKQYPEHEQLLCAYRDLMDGFAITAFAAKQAFGLEPHHVIPGRRMADVQMEQRERAGHYLGSPRNRSY